jgi:hypothetical protein
MPAFLTIAFTVFDKPLSNTNVIATELPFAFMEIYNNSDKGDPKFSNYDALFIYYPLKTKSTLFLSFLNAINSSIR